MRICLKVRNNRISRQITRLNKPFRLPAITILYKAVPIPKLERNNELKNIISDEDPSKMDGERIGDVIDKLKKATENIALPASAKQISYLQSLAESLEMDETTACDLVEVESFAELSGG